MAKKQLTLPEYIRQIGREEFMRRHGASKRNTVEYEKGRRRPKVDSDVAISLMKNSPVPFEGIYGS